MISMFLLQIFAAILIWIISVTGGSYAIYLHRQQHASQFLLQFAESFAGGIFLGAALFHMLPDAQLALKHIYGGDYPFANLICAAGFCLLLFLEQVVQHFQERRNTQSPNLIPILLTSLISVHALSEGIALGVNQQIASMLVIFIAIAVHKSSEGFAVGLQLQRGTLSLRTVILLFFLFSLMSPLGILAGDLTHLLTQGETSELLFGLFNAFAAGTFLYIATLHKLYHVHPHGKSHIGEFCATLLGLLLMASVAIWL